MTRKTLPIYTLYQSEISIWDAALSDPTNTVWFPVATRNHAIAMVHRLNRVRAAIRDQSAAGVSIYDTLVARWKAEDDQFWAGVGPRLRMSLTGLINGNGEAITPNTRFIGDPAVDARISEEMRRQNLLAQEAELNEIGARVQHGKPLNLETKE